MIKKLQRRFICITLIALTAAMVLVVSIVNIINWISVRQELYRTLDFIVENSTSENFADGSGAFPQNDDRQGRGGVQKIYDIRDDTYLSENFPEISESQGFRFSGKNKHMRNLVSESNWFSAFYDSSGTCRMIRHSQMTDFNEQTARELAEKALSGKKNVSFLQDYLYKIVIQDSGETDVFFLNCETKIASVRTLALLSALSCLGGIILAWIFVSLSSRKAVEPTIRNMEQQKQFITNASHELKTPLTVISTNMELLQMDLPDNPWIRSTQKQTAQMRHLVDELVYLSRMEEESAPLVMERLNLSEILTETAEPFIAMAEYQGKEMKLDIDNPLSVTGDRASIQRLISTLCDNAVKYAAGSEPILLAAKAEGRHTVITISNEITEPLTKMQCDQLFHRFYRTDTSRSKEKQKGFGIGLAIAAAIVEKHGGSINASMQDGSRIVFTCLLPIK